MEINKKMPITDVTSITTEFCELMDDSRYEVIRRSVDLFDEKGFHTYTTMLCCSVDDIEEATKEIEAQCGRDINSYILNNKYCHIATYKDTGKIHHDISFDDEEDCDIHANYNKEYKNIEEFFRRFIRFRNNLIQNNEIVKDDDCYQYFLSVKKGFAKKEKLKMSERIKRKIKRIK